MPCGREARAALRAMAALALLLCFAAPAFPAGPPGDGQGPGSELEERIERGVKDRYRNRRSACKLLGRGWVGDCNERAGLQVLVIGNSHAIDGYNFLRAAFAGPDVNIILFPGLNPCGELRVEQGRLVAAEAQCDDRLRALEDAVRSGRIDTVVYAANKPYAPNKASYLRLLRALRAAYPPLEFVTLGGYINTRVDCLLLMARFGGSAACKDPRRVSYFAGGDTHRKLERAFRALETGYIDRVELLCDDRRLENCLTETPDGVPMFYDRHHASFEFSAFAGTLFGRRYPRFLAAPGSRRVPRR